jgi:uncharacterized membrane protein HdeD (DUF308 family)
MDADRLPNRAETSHGTLFLLEGIVFVALGLLAIAVPAISSADMTYYIGWLFLVGAVIGLATTFWARRMPGFWWSLVSALLGILVGVVLIGNKSQDLYGGLLGWPFQTVGPLRMILVLFFLVEGGASIMFAFEHRRQFSGRWAWMLASGILDIALGCIIVFDLPGTSAFTMALLIGINMIVGGAALIAMGLHGRSGNPASNAALR